MRTKAETEPVSVLFVLISYSKLFSGSESPPPLWTKLEPELIHNCNDYSIINIQID